MKLARYMAVLGLALFSAWNMNTVKVAFAQDITVYAKFLPKRFMLVNKREQLCFLYNNDTVIQSPCSTGQVSGDKVHEGDKKTPEGLYFVTAEIPSPDYDEYGTKAFPLNYPNPFDVLDKKTGYGIWLHGRGRTFKLQDTRGCVAFAEKQILQIYKNFTVGYPVIIANTVTYDKNNSVPAQYVQLEKNVHTWTSAWSAQSNAFLQQYDPTIYPNFLAFSSNKKRIFQLFPFTYSQLGPVYIVAKGDAITTWFNQYYYAPNLLVEGTRRLYWKKNPEGVFRIIGETWIPHTTQSTKESLLVAMTPLVKDFLARWKTAWESGDVQNYMRFYGTKATQGRLQGKNAIASAKTALWKKSNPENLRMENVNITLTEKGIRVAFKQYYQAKGYNDVGNKVLYIIPYSNEIQGWYIQREDWIRS